MDNETTIVRAGHTYVWRWRDGQEAELFDSIAAMAAHPETPFTFCNAAELQTVLTEALLLREKDRRRRAMERAARKNDARCEGKQAKGRFRRWK
jgi:hypothetical protein